jgi:hypothetical protein
MRPGSKSNTKTDQSKPFSNSRETLGIRIESLAGIVVRDQPVTVVLKTGTFIDSAGRKLLTDMHGQGISACRRRMLSEKCVVEEITSERRFKLQMIQKFKEYRL